MPAPRLPVRIVSVHVYPVKSCHRLDPAAVTLGARGLVGDRAWMVTSPDGRFLTQRTHPALARIRPELDGERLLLRHPGMAPLSLPAQGDPAWARTRVRV